MSTYIDSNWSRRDLLRTLATASGAGILTGVGCQPGAKQNKSPTTLKLFGTGTLDIGADWSRLKQDTGIDLQFKDNGNDVGPVLTKMIAMTAATDYDLGGLQGGAEAELARAGKILPWDLNKIPNYRAVWSWAQNIPWAKWEQKQYGLPLVVNADSIIYLPHKTGLVDSYAMVFDRRFKGKASMEDAWINSAIFTAIYLKESGQAKIVDPGDLSEPELHTVIEFLIRQKRDGQFLKFWSGWKEGVDLITSGDVWIMTGWEPIVYAARSQGANVQYAVPKEGYEGWSNNLILHEGARERNLIDAAHEFANWELAGYYGCDLVKQRGYVVPNDNAIQYAESHPKEFDPALIKDTLERVRNKFLHQKGAVYWQNVRPKNYALYEDLWSKLRAA